MSKFRGFCQSFNVCRILEVLIARGAERCWTLLSACTKGDSKWKKQVLTEHLIHELLTCGLHAENPETFINVG